MGETINYLKVAKYIYKTPSGKYRIRVTVSGIRVTMTCDTRTLAVKLRDQLLEKPKTT